MSSYHLRTHTIYAYILQCQEKDQLPPTMREIASACDIPLTAIFRHLDWLQARGYIIRDTTTRSIRTVKPLLKDEEQVYKCIVRVVKVSDIAPSLKTLKQASGLSSSRVKAALQTLEQTGRVRPDPEDLHLFYPVDINS